MNKIKAANKVVSVAQKVRQVAWFNLAAESVAGEYMMM